MPIAKYGLPPRSLVHTSTPSVDGTPALCRGPRKRSGCARSCRGETAQMAGGMSPGEIIETPAFSQLVTESRRRRLVPSTSRSEVGGLIALRRTRRASAFRGSGSLTSGTSGIGPPARHRRDGDVSRAFGGLIRVELSTFSLGGPGALRIRPSQPSVRTQALLLALFERSFHCVQKSCSYLVRRPGRIAKERYGIRCRRVTPIPARGELRPS
jgi:hypothetical protein